MKKGIRVEVRGPYALFPYPELQAELVSCDVMTPIAARGVIEAIYWHPGLKWKIERIHVLSPIKFVTLRQNEVNSEVLASAASAVAQETEKPLMIYTEEPVRQRTLTALKDVHYVIDTHFELTDQAAPSDNAGKFIDITRRRLARGQFYQQPYLGCREFPATVNLWEGGPVPAINETRPLGLMMYDMDYSDPNNIRPTFFRAELVSGVLKVAGQRVLR